jgi:CelD/BcsL family acetyltransferase involved in cellulose biosynthesis
LNDDDHLTTEVLRDLPAFIALHDEWEELRGRARFAPVFLSHKWLRLSWEQRWRRLPNQLRIVLVRERGQLVMAGAFVVHLFNGWPAVHFLDSRSPQSDDVLYLASGDTGRQAQRLLAALRRSLPFPMTLRAKRLRDDSPLLPAAAALGWRTRTRQHTIASALTLTDYADFEAYLQSMSAKTRSGYRRHLRQLMELDRFSYRRETGEDRFVVLQWLFDRKREWLVRKGLRADWLADRSFDGFTKSLLRDDDAPPFWVLSMQTGERIIAASLCFCERDTLNYSKITQDPEFDRFSPGFTMNVLMIREAFAEGFARIDLGHGNFDTKSRLSKRTYEVMVARIHLR